MNAKVEQTGSASSAGDIAKYVLAIALVVVGVVGFYWFAGQWPGALRGAGLAVVIAAALFIAAFTAKGRDAREFIGEARFELRKVVWPTRQETIRLTGMILIVVVIVSLLLALIDWILGSAIRGLLG